MPSFHSICQSGSARSISTREAPTLGHPTTWPIARPVFADRTYLIKDFLGFKRHGKGTVAHMRVEDLIMPDVEMFNRHLVKKGYAASPVGKQMQMVKRIIDRASRSAHGQQRLAWNRDSRDVACATPSQKRTLLAIKPLDNLHAATEHHGPSSTTKIRTARPCPIRQQRARTTTSSRWVSRPRRSCETNDCSHTKRTPPSPDSAGANSAPAPPPASPSSRSNMRKVPPTSSSGATPSILLPRHPVPHGASRPGTGERQDDRFRLRPTLKKHRPGTPRPRGRSVRLALAPQPRSRTARPLTRPRNTSPRA